jgi:hypothetical protein
MESDVRFRTGHSTTDGGMDEGSTRASAASSELTSGDTAASELQSSFSSASSRVRIGVTFGFGGAPLYFSCFTATVHLVRLSCKCESHPVDPSGHVWSSKRH